MPRQGTVYNKFMGAVKIDEADRLWSRFIRSRAGWCCQRCGKYYEPPTSALHCSHFYGRGREATRYDEFNTFSLCYGCHRYLGSHPNEHRDFVISKIGQEEFDRLTLRANAYKKKDRKMEVIRIKEMLKGLDNEAQA